MISNEDLQEMPLPVAAFVLNVKSADALRKQIDAGQRDGMFYKVGDQWYTTKRRIAAWQEEQAKADS